MRVFIGQVPSRYMALAFGARSGAPLPSSTRRGGSPRDDGGRRDRATLINFSDGDSRGAPNSNIDGSKALRGALRKSLRRSQPGAKMPAS